MFIPTSGRKVWRFKYKLNGKEKLVDIGKYSRTGSYGLKEAREVRNELRAMLSQGVDPALAKIQSKNLKVITTITPVDIDLVIDPIVKRGALEVAERALSRIGAVFRYAIHKGWATDNPSFGKNEFLPSLKVKHMAHLSEDELPVFLNELEEYQGDFICKHAVKFTLLTHVRTDEIRFAEWDEVSLDTGMWSIPPERMKMNIAQIIPLSNQAVEILQAIKPITGQGKYIFASLQGTSKPISENGMLSVIYRMGYKGITTVHGFRAAYSTTANKTLKFRADVVEASLAHKVKDPVR